MNTVVIPKTEYLKIIKTQESLKKKVNMLQKMVEEEIQEEVRPEYIKKLDRLDAEMDKGKGTRFLSAEEAKEYLKNL